MAGGISCRTRGHGPGPGDMYRRDAPCRTSGACPHSSYLSPARRVKKKGDMYRKYMSPDSAPEKKEDTP
jgi:hypothetical protein